MKITKTKEIVAEDIEIKTGTYYFECENIISRKFILNEPNEDYSEYTMEILYNFHNNTGIKIINDGTWDENGLPYVFKQFILGITGKKIEKEEYYKERNEILSRL